MTGWYTAINLLGNAFEIYIVLEYFRLVFNKEKATRVSNKIICLGAAILTFLISMFLRDNNALTIIAVILSYVGLSCLYSGKIWTRIFLSILIYAFFLASEFISGVVMENILNVNIKMIQQNITYYLWGALVSKFLVFVVVKLISIQKFRYPDHPMSAQIVFMLSAFPFSSIVSIYVIALSTYKTKDAKVDLFASVSVVALMLSNIIVFYLFERQNELEEKNLRLEFMHSLFEMQREHYLDLYHSQEETRRIRHDIKNCLIAISGYLEAGEYQQAVQYISEYTGEIQKATGVINTGCPAIDAILTAKLQKADTVGAKLSYKIMLPESLLIDSIDLAAILANGLDNAIEAVSQLQGEKTIRLSIMPRQDYLTISILNPVNQAVNVHHLKTTKVNSIEHGYGLRNIRMIAGKYSGDVDIKSKASIANRNATPPIPD